MQGVPGHLTWKEIPVYYNLGLNLAVLAISSIGNKNTVVTRLIVSSCNAAALPKRSPVGQETQDQHAGFKPSGKPKLLGKEANGTITVQTVLCKHPSTSADYKETYFVLLTLAVVVQTHSLPAQWGINTNIWDVLPFTSK